MSNSDKVFLQRIATAALPQKYEAAREALRVCESVDECKTWADKAEALRSYSRQSKDEEMMKTAMRIRDRAIRRCGELLLEFQKAKNQHSANFAGVGAHTGRMKAGADAGLSKNQAIQAIRVANIPKDLFEEQVESAEEAAIAYNTAAANLHGEFGRLNVI